MTEKRTSNTPNARRDGIADAGQKHRKPPAFPASNAKETRVERVAENLLDQRQQFGRQFADFHPLL